MIYRQVRIDVLGKKWVVSVKELPMDREDVVTVPNAMGWYNYPETMSDPVAFRKLKLCMVRRHKRQIADLQKSLGALQGVLLYPGRVQQWITTVRNVG